MGRIDFSLPGKGRKPGQLSPGGKATFPLAEMQVLDSEAVSVAFELGGKGAWLGHGRQVDLATQVEKVLLQAAVAFDNQVGESLCGPFRVDFGWGDLPTFQSNPPGGGAEEVVESSAQLCRDRRITFGFDVQGVEWTFDRPLDGDRSEPLGLEARGGGYLHRVIVCGPELPPCRDGERLALHGQGGDGHGLALEGKVVHSHRSDGPYFLIIGQDGDTVDRHRLHEQIDRHGERRQDGFVAAFTQEHPDTGTFDLAKSDITAQKPERLPCDFQAVDGDGVDAIVIADIVQDHRAEEAARTGADGENVRGQPIADRQQAAQAGRGGDEVQQQDRDQQDAEHKAATAPETHQRSAPMVKWIRQDPSSSSALATSRRIWPNTPFQRTPTPAPELRETSEKSFMAVPLS